MNESYCTSMIMTKMKQRGMLARKIAGTLHSANMPDFYACFNGVTVFFESKLFKVTHLSKMSRIPMQVTPQMISMVEHQVKAAARYLLFVHDGDMLRVWCVEPHLLMGLVRGNGLVEPGAFFIGVTEWLDRDLGKLFRKQ